MVKIRDCLQVADKRVLPIFYDVDPSDVRKQSGDYKEAFSKYEQTFKDDKEKLEEMGTWKKALTEVASLSGWDLRNKSESAEIEHIVKEIVSISGYREISVLPKDLVGIHSRIEQLEKLLDLGSVDDVRVVGICGIGGIGKTTLATATCERIHRQYDAYYSIDVSQIHRDHDPNGVRKKILRTLNGEIPQIHNPCNAPILVRSRLHRARALVVLDNVDQDEELLNREWFGAGSRIIIISRNEHIFKRYGVDAVYKVPILNFDHSRQLFCRSAFRREGILTDYEKLTYDILQYADGLPLAITILGSSLLGREVSEWKSALAKLRENPQKDIMNVLRLSFDGLEDNEKEIFLDIACFFSLYCKESFARKVLTICGFHADIGLSVLVERSLISIVYHWQVGDRIIEMHNLLRDLGTKIVQEYSTEKPRKWSRIWLNKQFHNVKLENMEKKVEAIGTTPSCMYVQRETLTIDAETLSRMSRLRMLMLGHGGNISGNFYHLSNELKYLEWYQFPLLYFPSSFQPDHLVELILKHSSIKQLWEDKKNLPKLEILNLSHSENLITIPDLEWAPVLKQLDLEGCRRLAKIHPSIGKLQNLVFLNLKDCESVVSIPNNILELSSLEYLDLSGCSKVNNNLGLAEWIASSFHFLESSSHNDSARSSCPSFPSFVLLRNLDLSFCNLPQITDHIGSLYCLETLSLRGHNFVTLPSLKELSSLVYLNLEHCKQLEILPELPSSTRLPLRKKMPESTLDPGLCAFSCPKLGESKHCTNMTFLWMKQCIQAHQESSYRCRKIDIIIPGSVIPNWFTNQSMGSNHEITLDLASVMHEDNWIGIACCVVFVAAPLHGPTGSLSLHGCEVAMSISNGIATSFFWPELILKGDLITVESNHLWLTFINRQQFHSWVEHVNATPKPPMLRDLKMYVRARSAVSLRLEVKNFGWRWVFQEDLEQCNSMLHSGSWPLAIEDSAQPQS